MLDAERAYTVARDRPQPGKRRRMSIQHGDDAAMRRHIGEQPINVDAEKQFLCRPQRFTEEHLKTHEHLSRRASQQSIPAAIAESHVATAKGRSRAVIKLVVEAAMVRAVEVALSESQMVSKLPRQELAAPLRNRDRD